MNEFYSKVSFFKRNKTKPKKEENKLTVGLVLKYTKEGVALNFVGGGATFKTNPDIVVAHHKTRRYPTTQLFGSRDKIFPDWLNPLCCWLNVNMLSNLLFILTNKDSKVLKSETSHRLSVLIQRERERKKELRVLWLINGGSFYSFDFMRCLWVQNPHWWLGWLHHKNHIVLYDVSTLLRAGFPIDDQWGFGDLRSRR